MYFLIKNFFIVIYNWLKINSYLKYFFVILLLRDNYKVHSVYFVSRTRCPPLFNFLFWRVNRTVQLCCRTSWSAERHGICIFIGILRPTERWISVVHARDPPILLYSSLIMFVYNPFERGSRAGCHENYW